MLKLTRLFCMVVALYRLFRQASCLSEKNIAQNCNVCQVFFSKNREIADFPRTTSILASMCELSMCELSSKFLHFSCTLKPKSKNRYSEITNPLNPPYQGDFKRQCLSSNWKRTESHVNYLEMFAILSYNELRCRLGHTLAKELKETTY